MNAKQNLYSICIMVLDRLEISILLFVLVGIILVREYMPKITSYLDGKHEDPAFLAVLHQHTKIVKDSSEADIVVPVESSTIASPQTGQVLIHVSNDKVIMDRNSLWKLFCRKGGRSFASEYIPEIFIICQDSASDDYEEFLKRKTEWPSLMFRPFILKNEAKNDTEGLYMTQSDLEDGLKELKNNNLLTRTFATQLGSVYNLQYTVIQKVLSNPYIHMSRGFKLELYIAFTSEGGKTSGHCFHDGLVYWTRSRWNPNDQTIDNTVASRSLMRKGRTREKYERVYSRYPRTLQELMKALGNEKSRAMFSDVLRVLKKMCEVCCKEIGNEFTDNSTSGLYAVEVALDDKSRAWLLQISKPPGYSDTQAHETKLRTEVWEDLFKIQNVILTQNESKFSTIYEQ